MVRLKKIDQKPVMDALKELLMKKGFTFVASELGYSTDNTVRNWLYTSRIPEIRINQVIDLLNKENISV